VGLLSASLLTQPKRRLGPLVTDCDRLDDGFGALVGRGLVALQTAGHTRSDGYDGVMKAFRNRTDAQSVIGYCFFHGPDLKWAVAGGGLYIALGQLTRETNKSRGQTSETSPSRNFGTPDVGV
jgi:hypothetical protein